VGIDPYLAHAGLRGLASLQQGLQLEALVARHADRLFVISDQLGDYVQRHWGIERRRMGLLPNCIDLERFAVGDLQAVDAETVGYAGSLMGYEGLDTLIEAVALLAQKGRAPRLELVGDGEARAGLEALVQRLGLSERVRFFGKMPPEAARARLGRCALVCIPRKPFKVCEIVPPIKLVEALAMGKPVIVPDLPVFRDEMGDSSAGWFFRAGDAADLARVLQAALADQDALAQRGALARAHAAEKRRWDQFVPGLCGALHMVGRVIRQFGSMFYAHPSIPEDVLHPGKIRPLEDCPSGRPRLRPNVCRRSAGFAP